MRHEHISVYRMLR